MRRSHFFLAMIVLAAVSLSACKKSAEEPVSSEPTTGIANPWRDCTEDEAYQYGPNGFSAPEGATNVEWSLMLPGNDPEKSYFTLVQMTFDLDGHTYTAREQATEEGEKDISGMYINWQSTESVALERWANGSHPTATIKTYTGSGDSAKVCQWYDAETGCSYSLGVSGTNLSNVDIKKIAEAIYDPAKQIGANASEIPESAPEEISDEGLKAAAEDAAPAVDISGCDTFTQIVDRKLSDGMGYANAAIGNEDVLLVSSGVYDNLDGNMAAIDASIFMYKDGAPYEVGKVCSGGTAYPLAVKDGILYTAGNHWICKYTIEDDSLVVTHRAAVVYDEKGNETYYYESADGKDNNNYDTVKTKEMFEALFDELFDAEVIGFSEVGGETAALPPYEYPGPEAFYSVLYQYLIDEFGGNYPEAEVTIPCPVIIAEDESDRDDIRVWGDFWIFNYNLNGDVLENTSGGSYPGVIHLQATDDAAGYKVTKMEVVGDGSQFEPTAKRIFGNYYKELLKSSSDTEEREKIRAQIIANYAAANNLNITAYQDFGWDPVTLPEENIDSFYSEGL